jgi:hypothetical protein
MDIISNEDDFSLISPVISGVRITQSFAVCVVFVFTPDIPGVQWGSCCSIFCFLCGVVFTLS